MIRLCRLRQKQRQRKKINLLIKADVHVFGVGNDNLHLLTSDKRQVLRIDMGDFENNTRYAEYDNFVVDSANDLYSLTSVGTYSGTAGQ